VLLNILVALFNQAYSVVTDNAIDEFLALFTLKTLNFIRAPDENTFCPPLNLIEIFLIIPFEPFLKKTTYQRINEWVLKVIYSPALAIIAFYESRLLPLSIWPDCRIQAPQLTHSKLIGLDIGQEAMGWDIDEEFNPEASGWAEKVRSTIPNIDEDEMVLLRRLEKKFELLEGRAGIDVQDRKDIRPSQREGWGEGTGRGLSY